MLSFGMASGYDQAVYRAVVDTMVDGVIGIDGDGMVRFCNPACGRMLGYSADEVIGENIAMLTPRRCSHAHAEPLGDCIRRCAQETTANRREVELRRKDGAVLQMEIACGEAQHGGRPFCVATLRDITERKRGETSPNENAANSRRAKRPPA